MMGLEVLPVTTLLLPAAQGALLGGADLWAEVRACASVGINPQRVAILPW